MIILITLKKAIVRALRKPNALLLFNDLHHALAHVSQTLNIFLSFSFNLVSDSLITLQFNPKFHPTLLK